MHLTFAGINLYMTFQCESIRTVLPEMEPLLKRHWKEIAHYKDIPLEPDYDLYFKMEDQGFIKIFTVRNDANTLVGYAAYFIKANIHYKSSKQAVEDVIFIDKEARGEGHKFIDWCDQELKEIGVQLVHHHVKVAHNFGPTLERLGYEHVEHIYSRRLN